MAEGQLVSTGGRVLGVTAMAGDALEAQTLAYQAVDKVSRMRCTCVFFVLCTHTCYIHTYMHPHTHIHAHVREIHVYILYMFTPHALV